ncbi:dihydroxyacetone kinase family protein [Listeria fleischmannii FSL S10-1203]|uniref:Dihydroxyacetone kinase family protein n=1 Tax=Listeria fleischmannii FSL S10-1203 TaxID=1265822 RepID=W7DFA4_9LIST|nr:dihydroxyacetone kinase family protein [Listeria fleischmannii FSL S10-1203]
MLKKIESRITNDFSDVEFEIHEGGQPVYPYIFSVE